MYFISILWEYSLPFARIAEYSFIIFHHFAQCQYSMVHFRDIVLAVSISLLVLNLRTMEKVSRCFASKMNQHYLASGNTNEPLIAVLRATIVRKRIYVNLCILSAEWCWGVLCNNRRSRNCRTLHMNARIRIHNGRVCRNERTEREAYNAAFLPPILHPANVK